MQRPWTWSFRPESLVQRRQTQQCDSRWRQRAACGGCTGRCDLEIEQRSCTSPERTPPSPGLWGKKSPTLQPVGESILEHKRVPFQTLIKEQNFRWLFNWTHSLAPMTLGRRTLAGVLLKMVGNKIITDLGIFILHTGFQLWLLGDLLVSFYVSLTHSHCCMSFEQFFLLSTIRCSRKLMYFLPQS